ncbi:hypothetical protein RUM44_002655 [Polyplax serrata]|uniref:Exoribonuclease phosphorolytic domain-containing protein n=1 Tax=Polyplax serrata TaxID=468196 RepID=A0ABR1AFD4_POLSC
MPIDSRRLQVPADSEGYRQYINQDVKNYEARLREILNDKKLRFDGRVCDEQRKIYMKTGVVTQAKGSAYVEMNKTKVLVSVFDPREIPRLSEFTPNGELYCEFKFAPFSSPERRGHVMDMEEKDLSVILRRSLEPAVCRHEFPNFQVDIYALLLDNDGACLSAAITAAGLAMADAGIPMYDILTSVSLGIQNDTIIVDPTLKEENFCRTFFEGHTKEMGLISLSYMPTMAQVTELTQTGTVKVETVLKCMDLLIQKCTNLSHLTQKCLVESVKQQLGR